jgi:hypothetical protein
MNPMYQNLAILCAFIFVYSVVSKGLERRPTPTAYRFSHSNAVQELDICDVSSTLLLEY